jgi:cold shock protein
MHGRIKMFDQSRGYGFIKRDDGGPDAFVHIKFCRGFVPAKNQRVEFVIVRNPQNDRDRADDVRLLLDEPADVDGNR